VGLEMLRESAGILESLAAGPARVVTPTRLLVHCQLMLSQIHLNRSDGKISKKTEDKLWYRLQEEWYYCRAGLLGSSVGDP
jgi:hypothetical protein